MCGTKLSLWLRSWSSSLSALTRTTHRSFYHCITFCVQINSSLWTMSNVIKRRTWMSWVRKYAGTFPKRMTNNWIRYLFHALPPVHSPISEQESLIKISTSSSVKIEFNQKPLPDFWIGLHSGYPALANRSVKTLMPFATTYLCESGFSGPH